MSEKCESGRECHAVRSERDRLRAENHKETLASDAFKLSAYNTQLEREIAALKSQLAEAHARNIELVGKIIDAQQAFVELWGVASGAEERFTDDLEALEWVDIFARKHDKLLNAVVTNAPARAKKILAVVEAAKKHRENCDCGGKECATCKALGELEAEG